jgi:hypothetical protein
VNALNAKWDPWEEQNNPPYKNWKGVDHYLNPNAVLFVNEKEREVIIRTQTAFTIATIRIVRHDVDIYEYFIEQGSEKSKFMKTTPLHHLLPNKNTQFHRELKIEFKNNNIIPPGSGSVDDRMDVYLNGLSNFLLQSKVEIDKYFNKWLKESREATKEPYFKPEYYSDEQIAKARELMVKNNVMDSFYKVISYMVVGQKAYALANMGIALSSVMDYPMHSIAIGGPGTGKSRVMDTVYDLFPTHRKIELYPDTTANFLLRMTQWKEGSKFFNRKLVSLDDLGDKDEQKKASALLSVFKVLMSKRMYKKGVADPDEKGKNIEGKILELIGCGSVFVQMVTLSGEPQFGSRAFKWSPHDDSFSREEIKKYQEDELGGDFKEIAYARKRPVVRCMVDFIYKFVEHWESTGSRFRIKNPFNKHLNKMLNVDASPNANRDRLMIQNMPKMVTLCNCFSRDVYFNEVLNQYVQVVTPEDYMYVLEQMGVALSSFIQQKSGTLYRYIEIVDDMKKGSGYGFEELKCHVDGLSNQSQKPKSNTLKSSEYEEESITELTGFTYADVAKYTNVTERTVSDYIKRMEELELLVIDKSSRQHRIYVPSGFKERASEIMNFNIVKEFYDENPEALKLEVEEVYNKFINQLKDYDYELVETATISKLLNPKNIGEDGGVTLEI